MTMKFQGNRVAAEARDDASGRTFAVVLDRRLIVAEFTRETWADAFARVLDAFVPTYEHGGKNVRSHETAVNVAFSSMLTIAGARHLVAGVLARAEDMYRARALAADDEDERDRCHLAAQLLRDEVHKLGKSEHNALPRSGT